MIPIRRAPFTPLATMSHFAIIIGVNDYPDPSWKLGAAVDDALAFLEWALGPGGVPRENVRLLLSPPRTEGLPVPCEPADSRNILKVIQEFQKGLGADGDRLYFYYAGHGAAAPGARDEAVIIPADVESLHTDYPRLIGFSQILPPLQHAGPAAQFFFIDACRDLVLEDFTRGAAPVVGRWRGPPAQDAPRRRAQYLLYATSPGERALETGRGVFGQILLEGLRGHPGALVWSSRTPPRYELRFSQVAEYVRTTVEARAKSLAGPWRRFVQLPEQDIPPGPSGPKDFVLASFSPEQVGKLPLRIRVQPGPVRQKCGVKVLYYAPGGLEISVHSVQPQPPSPLPFPVELQLPPGDYTVLAHAAEHREAREPCALYRPQSVDLMLQAMTGALDPIHDPLRGHTGHPAPPDALPEILTVRSEDPLVQIVCLDPDRQAHTGLSRVSIDQPPAGIYRARLVFPEGSFQEQTLEVHKGGPREFVLGAPPLPLGKAQQDMLHELGLPMDFSRYTYPSDKLGPVAQLRLASLLGFAAFQASAETPPAGSEGPLGRLGILPPAPIPPGGSGLLVLLGASGSQPAPGASIPEFLARSRLTLRSASTGGIIAEGAFEKLSRFGAAAQWGQALSPGTWLLELSLPHLAPTLYALAALRDHLGVLIVVADDSGEVEVQQYMVPLAGPGRRHPSPAPLEMWGLRHVELGQRYLAAGALLPPRLLQPFLTGKCLDPLLGCITGYALIREGKQEHYRSFTPRNAPGRAKRFPMREMLRCFDELPDVHVLAGLCEPEYQDAHFQHALDRGLPLFADGLRALQRHASQAKSSWLTDASRGLLPASTWTAWIKR